MNQTKTFDDRCHFCPIVLVSTTQSQTQIRKPSKTYSRASIIARIETAQRAAETLPPEKKLGVDLREKSIKKVTSTKKEVSDREMEQVIKSLNSLGLENPTSQNLSAAMEGLSLTQNVPMQITSPRDGSEKQKDRNKRALIQMALIDYAVRSKLPREEQGTARFSIDGISFNKPKLGK